MPARHTIEVVFRAPMTLVARRIPPAYAILEQASDGGVMARWPADDIDDHARYLVGLGLPFEVRDPPELHAALRRLAAELMAVADQARGHSGLAGPRDDQYDQIEDKRQAGA